MSLAWSAYRVLAPVLGAAAPAARLFASPRERPFWNERLGRVPAMGARDAWIHAASLGEATAVPPLAEALLALAPGARLFLTATTRAGRERLAGAGAPVALAPLDAPQVIDRFFERVAPRRVLLVETELWPHWLLRARLLGVPVVVVSGRLSAYSVGRYRSLGSEFRGLVGGLAGVVCQSEADAARWLAIGAQAERLAVCGNLKFDALPQAPDSRAGARMAAGLERDRPLLVLGSLRRGEARILARAWQRLPPALAAGWQVVAVPRHTRATRELVDEANAAATEISANGRVSVRAWRWDDRPGVLPAYYAGADVAFVGGSLAPWGGHNPLEPAACGAAVVMGPHHASQLEGVRALETGSAIAIARDEDDCTRVLERLLGDAGARAQVARAARTVAASLRGAAQRTTAQLAAWKLWPVE